MSRLLVLLAVLLQAGALGWMAWEREFILHHSRLLELATAPVDPRDIFRGDYVRLDYRISTLPHALAGPGLRQRPVPRGGRVFTRLTVDDGKPRVLSVDDQRPAEGPYLTGNLVRAWNPAQTSSELHIKYGIEKYFVEQGRGRELERRRRREDGLQTPIYVSVAVNGRGTAVIHSIRWGDLGIGLRFDRPEEDAATTRGLDLVLENVSENPLTLLLAPGQCSFRLEPARSIVPDQPLPQRPACERPDPQALRRLTLAPGERHQEHFAFAAASWWVSYQGRRKPIGELPWGHTYRLVYEAPATARDSGAWSGEIRSAAFHGRGRVD